jgi:hypothetical protein
MAMRSLCRKDSAKRVRVIRAALRLAVVMVTSVTSVPENADVCRMSSANGAIVVVTDSGTWTAALDVKVVTVTASDH